MITELTLPIVIAAAAADSINPCVFGVLIFLISYMTKVFKSPRRMLVGGLVYAAAVYLTYLGLGFGILRITISVGISNFFYWFAALIAIGAGLLEIKDFFAYGRGLSLQLIPGSAERIKMYTAKMGEVGEKSPALSMALAALLGVFVVFVELPCTGAPYFAILALLSKGAFATAVPYLLLYNLVFILPLLAGSRPIGGTIPHHPNSPGGCHAGPGGIAAPPVTIAATAQSAGGVGRSRGSARDRGRLGA